MAKMATYRGPWDNRTFTAQEIERDEDAAFAKGVPQKVTNAVAEKLEATREFLIEDVEGEEQEQLKFGEELDVPESDGDTSEGETGEAGESTEAPQLTEAQIDAGGAVQSGDAVTTSSTTTTGSSTGTSGSTGRGRASSRRSS